MSHKWIYKLIPQGSKSVDEKCRKCGARSRRYTSGRRVNFDGGVKCGNRAMRRDELASEINRRLVFYALGCMAIFMASCVSPKVNGHWRPASDVLGRMFSRPDSARKDSLVRAAHCKQIKINSHEHTYR